MRRPWARRLVTIITAVVLVASVSLAVLMVLPSLLGYHRYVITSNSMAPALPSGSIVFDREVSVEDLKVGDIITFVPPPEFGISHHVTHRIAQIDPNAIDINGQSRTAFRTKGDNNSTADPWQITLDRPTQAVVAHHIRYVGYVYLLLSLRWVQISLVGVPALLIAIGLGYLLWQAAGDAVREEREQEGETEDAKAVWSSL